MWDNWYKAHELELLITLISTGTILLVGGVWWTVSSIVEKRRQRKRLERSYEEHVRRGEL